MNDGNNTNDASVRWVKVSTSEYWVGHASTVEWEKRMVGYKPRIARVRGSYPKRSAPLLCHLLNVVRAVKRVMTSLTSVALCLLAFRVHY